MPSLAEQAQTIANLYQPPATGRPSDLGSPSTLTQFLEAVGEGNYIETAAKLAGLSKAAVYNWIKRGQAGEPAYAEFVDALEKAEARAEAAMVANVRKASHLPQFWAAGMTVLERRHPERWGKRQDDTNTPKVVVQIGGPADVKIAIATFASEDQQLSLCKTQPSRDLVSENEDYVNERAIGAAPTQAARIAGEISAVESPGGPYPAHGEAQLPSVGVVDQRASLPSVSAVGGGRIKKRRPSRVVSRAAAGANTTRAGKGRAGRNVPGSESPA